jgi:glycosyltransferase involved in cell wall biosynthesis
MPDKKLIIIWKWDYKKQLEKIIKSKNIFFAGARYGDELVFLVQNSLGLIFPWEEDFWIVPVETMAAWKPVFAFWKWWLLESIIPWKTWEFFYNKTWEDFVEKFLEFDKKNRNNFYLKENCKKQAQKFSSKNFKEKLKNFVFK